MSPGLTYGSAPCLYQLRYSGGCTTRRRYGSSCGVRGCHPDMISWLTQRVRNLGSLYRDVTSSLWIVWDVVRPDAPNLCTCGVWSHHMLASAERATRPQGTLLKSAHSHCIPWRPATSTRSGSRRSGMVIETVYETVRVFQTNNNNNNNKCSASYMMRC